MQTLTATDLEARLPFPKLITALEQAFREEYRVPLRHHHDYPIPGRDQEGTLLLMPAWDDGRYFGIKIVAISPHNRQEGRPTIQGQYILFETDTGTPLLQLDAKALTNLRTAAASALASRFLSRPGSRTLLMVGTGALAPYLIRAHASVRPVEQVFIWGRGPEKAQRLAKQLKHFPFSANAVESLPEKAAEADIISCATLSPTPLILGEWLRPGQHLDLVGSFKPDMRETDDEAIRRAQVYVDTREGALKETGDILIPIQRGVLRPEDIRGSLFSLCRGESQGRQSETEITIFKSVGHALEDLAAAKLARLSRSGED